MGKLLGLATAIGIAVAVFAGGAAAGKLVPGGWLEPIPLPKPQPAAPPPTAPRPALRSAATPHRGAHHRERARRPAPHRAQPVAEGRVRF